MSKVQSLPPQPLGDNEASVLQPVLKTGVTGKTVEVRFLYLPPFGRVAELADALDLGSSGHGRKGSNPFSLIAAETKTRSDSLPATFGNRWHILGVDTVRGRGMRVGTHGVLVGKPRRRALYCGNIGP